jgi:hypothetical protein
VERYFFHIYVTAHGGSDGYGGAAQWFPSTSDYYELHVVCPTSGVGVTASAAYSTVTDGVAIYTTFLGSDWTTTPSSTFNFPDFESNLPICSFIRGYELID